MMAGDSMSAIAATMLMGVGLGFLATPPAPTGNRQPASPRTPPKSGNRRLDTGSYRNEQGQPIPNRNSTKLISTENEFRNAIMEAPFPIMIHNSQGDVLLINKRWSQLSGYSAEEIPSLQAWMDTA